MANLAERKTSISPLKEGGLPTSELEPGGQDIAKVFKVKNVHSRRHILCTPRDFFFYCYFFNSSIITTWKRLVAVVF